MKITFVAQHLMASGGAERVLSVFANEMANRCGFEVSVVLMYPLLREYSLHQNINRVTLFESAEAYKNCSVQKRVSKLRSALKELDADYAIPFLWFIGLYTALASLGLKTKVIQTVRNNPALVPGSAPMRLMRAFAVATSAGCFTQNQAQRDYFPWLLRRKMVVIPNPVSHMFFECNCKPSSSNQIVMVGRLEDQKNQTMLLDAIARLAVKGETYQVLLYGTGKKKAYLEGYIADLGLEGTGRLMGQTSDVAAVFSNAGLYVLTSRYEGQPNSLLEAMASGLPCISTDCPTGPSDFIVDGVNGYLVDIDDTDTLTQRISMLMNDPARRDAIGREAKKTIALLCSPSVLTERLIDAFIS